MEEKKRELYPEIEPFNTGHLQVSDLHKIYYEECGNKNGNPVIFVHGGPGGGTGPNDRRFFDPAAYHIILFDQRGAGKSEPAAELKENTTWELVEDMERLRRHLEVGRWVVFGGSWGSTLSLTYAETHPSRVKALVLRGIFNLRRRELLWYYQDGASHIFPDYFEKYKEPIPVVEQHDMMGAYYRRLTGDDEKVRLQCARAWSGWEMATSRLYVDPKMQEKTDSDVWSLQFARIECHYFVNGGFFREDEQILKDADNLKNIPGTIVQKWPEAEFHMIPDAGHSAREPGIADQLVRATDKYKNLQ